MSHTCVDMCGEVLKLPVKPLVRLVLLNYINFSCFQLHISSLCRGIYSQVIYIVHFDHFPIPIPPPPLRFIFPPANKVEFITQNDAFLRFFPLFYGIFLRFFPPFHFFPLNLHFFPKRPWYFACYISLPLQFELL